MPAALDSIGRIPVNFGDEPDEGPYMSGFVRRGDTPAHRSPATPAIADFFVSGPGSPAASVLRLRRPNHSRLGRPRRACSFGHVATIHLAPLAPPPRLRCVRTMHTAPSLRHPGSAASARCIRLPRSGIQAPLRPHDARLAPSLRHPGSAASARCTAGSLAPPPRLRCVRTILSKNLRDESTPHQEGS